MLRSSGSSKRLRDQEELLVEDSAGPVGREVQVLIQRGESMRTYSYRTKIAGAYDQRLNKAVSAAKAHWGSGWGNLTENMQKAYVCLYLCGELGGVDFAEAFTPTTDLEKKLLSRLVDIAAVCGDAVR